MSVCDNEVDQHPTREGGTRATHRVLSLVAPAIWRSLVAVALRRLATALPEGLVAPPTTDALDQRAIVVVGDPAACGRVLDVIVVAVTAETVQERRGCHILEKVEDVHTEGVLFKVLNDVFFQRWRGHGVDKGAKCDKLLLCIGRGRGIDIHRGSSRVCRGLCNHWMCGGRCAQRLLGDIRRLRLLHLLRFRLRMRLAREETEHHCARYSMKVKGKRIRRARR